MRLGYALVAALALPALAFGGGGQDAAAADEPDVADKIVIPGKRYAWTCSEVKY